MKLDLLLDLKRLLLKPIVASPARPRGEPGRDRRQLSDRRSSTRPNRTGHSRRVSIVDRRAR